MKTNTTLLIVDPQNDFCDLPNEWLPTDPLSGGTIAPALPVPGAHVDMLRLAAFIEQSGSAIDQMVLTLDSHHRLDIAHPGFWTTDEGGAVAPFSTITAEQVRAEQYRPRDPAALARSLAYLDALEAAERYKLMVWPVHCEIGSWGHAVHAAVRAAYNRWEERRLRTVQKVSKGSNPWTEHYSALQAEVPDANDEGTQLNHELIAQLDRADLILVAGEASSHCVKATLEHLALNLPSRRLDKLMLLVDAMSPITGFEAQTQAFVEDLKRQGARTATCEQALALLQAQR